jgi:hypothetical protein
MLLMIMTLELIIRESGQRFVQMVPITLLSYLVCSTRCEYDILNVLLKTKDQNQPYDRKEVGKVIVFCGFLGSM